MITMQIYLTWLIVLALIAIFGLFEIEFIKVGYYYWYWVFGVWVIVGCIGATMKIWGI
jgi:hypothetical protein